MEFCTLVHIPTSNVAVKIVTRQGYLLTPSVNRQTPVKTLSSRSFVGGR